MNTGRNIYCLIFICIIQTFFLPTAFANDTLKLSLAEAIALALKQNRRIENAYLDRIVQQFDLHIANTEFSPKLTLNSQIQFSQALQQYAQNYGSNATLSLKTPIGGQWALSSVYDFNGDIAADSIDLSYRQPLLKGGGLTVGTANKVLAQWAEKSHILSLKNTLSEIITQVIKQYRAYVSALQALEISRLSLSRSEQQLEVNRELVKSQRLAAVELIQAETSMVNQILSVRSAENRVSATRVALASLLRLKVNIDIQPTELLTLIPFTEEINSLKNIAFTQRYDYLQAKIAIDQAHLHWKLAQNNQLWAIDAVLRYGLAQNGNQRQTPLSALEHPEQATYSIGLELSMPLWDLSPERQLLASRIDLKKSRNLYLDLKENISLALENARGDIQIRWQQVGLAKRALALSKKQLSLEQEKLIVGRSSSFQIVSFQNSLVEAETVYLNAKIEYLNALTDLDMFLGITLQHWGIQLEGVK